MRVELILEKMNTVRDRGRDEAEAFDCGAGFAGKANHQCFIDDGGEAARQNRMWSEFEGLCAHDLSETRQFPLRYLTHGLWRHVARCRACPARGEDDLCAHRARITNRSLNL